MSFHIVNNIEKYITLSKVEKHSLIDIVEERSILRKEYLTQPGAVCKSQFYVVEGSFWSYFTTSNGERHTISLAIEDWFISDFNSYITQSPGSLHIEALENAIVQSIEYQKTEELCKKHPVFERYFRIVAQKAFAFSQQRILRNIGSTAEERYDQFLNQYPNIANRLPQYTIASYLGMSAEFYSKIRKSKLSAKA